MTQNSEEIPIEEHATPADPPLPQLFLQELKQLHATLHAVNPAVVPAEFTPEAMLEVLKRGVDWLTPESVKTIQDALEGAQPQDFLDPDTWRGLFTIAQMQLDERAGPWREQLQKLPGFNLLSDLGASLEGAEPKDFLDPDTWKGVFFLMNHQAQAQLDSLKEKLRQIDQQ